LKKENGMPPIIRIYRSGELISESEGVKGETLLRHICAAGVYIDAPCGGKGRCGKCLVRLSPEGEKVLACRTGIDGDMDVYLPDEAEMLVSSEFGSPDPDFAAQYAASSPSNPARHAPLLTLATQSSAHAPLGVAIDIGTTTVVAHLADLETGARIATASGVNAQKPYGADVISRIQYCAENGHETLTRLIREQIASLIRQTCAVSAKQTRDISYVSIAANTIMEHIAAGYSPIGMGIAPFTPVSLFGAEIQAWDGLPAAKNAKIFFAPAISSYVGGDITAGMLAAGLEYSSRPTVYLDIGTNGEIAMKAGNTYYCCATAAGPAFEGAEITMGMAAVAGAINHVKWDDGLILSVIGDREPFGLCGSGLIDALAVLLDTGAVDGTGRLLGSDEIDHEIARHICKIDGKKVFRLVGDGYGVFMSALDIRKLQLAKAAIAAGLQTLLQYAGIAERHVSAFVLAGGFGSYMDKYSAARIGLFPKCFLPVTRALGNTAGEGAALALYSEEMRETLSGIRERCKYIELSTSNVFNEQFVEQITFPD